MTHRVQRRWSSSSLAGAAASTHARACTLCKSHQPWQLQPGRFKDFSRAGLVALRWSRSLSSGNDKKRATRLGDGSFSVHRGHSPVVDLVQLWPPLPTGMIYCADYHKFLRRRPPRRTKTCTQMEAQHRHTCTLFSWVCLFELDSEACILYPAKIRRANWNFTVQSRRLDSSFDRSVKVTPLCSVETRRDATRRQVLLLLRRRRPEKVVRPVLAARNVMCVRNYNMSRTGIRRAVRYWLQSALRSWIIMKYVLLHPGREL